MHNVLTRKLGRLARLGPEDEALLASTIKDAKAVRANQVIANQGAAAFEIHLILSGMAYRHKHLEDGTRQIVSFLMPGDFCDLDGLILSETEYTISTLTACTVVSLTRRTLLSLAERPAIAHALWLMELADASILRESLVNIGRRRSDMRLAHFFCEMLTRLRSVGCVVDDRFDFPITQTELGDALGLSTVHTNRILQQLRDGDFIAVDRKSVTILDVAGLKAFCGFNPDYLHLGRPPATAGRHRGH